MTPTEYIQHNSREIIAARIRQKITRLKLVDLTGLSLRTIVAAENNQKVSINSIIAIRKALNLPL
jgi:transcriptional regulator with XRE-family HTH domain